MASTNLCSHRTAAAYIATNWSTGLAATTAGAEASRPVVVADGRLDTGIINLGLSFAERTWHEERSYGVYNSGC